MKKINFSKLVAILVIFAYIFAVIRAEVLADSYDKGFYFVMGFTAVPLGIALTCLMGSTCVESIKNIGKRIEVEDGTSYWSKSNGVCLFIISLPFFLLFLVGTIWMLLITTGIVPLP